MDHSSIQESKKGMLQPVTFTGKTSSDHGALSLQLRLSNSSTDLKKAYKL